MRVIFRSDAMGLTAQQVQTYRDEGVLVDENILTEEDLAPIEAEYSAWLDRKAEELMADGKLTETFRDASFDKRFGLLYAQTPEISKGLDIMFVLGKASFEFLKNPNLLNAVASLLGSEITCSPIQHIRAKPPASDQGSGAGFYNVPWHQDAGVTWQEADDSDIITCWLPLVDATVENGCMEVIPGVWKNGYLAHHADNGTTIRPEFHPVAASRPVPVKRGGVIFMHRYTPHRSTPNNSDVTRWSLDLRYQPTGVPTGRPFHPDFVARSSADPASVLKDHLEWAKRWEEALETSKGVQMHRV